LFVEPQARRRGIGRALVDACLAEAARGGAKALHVIGNPNAQSFILTYAA
jgi:predicted N-acetyltransferase YhbS